MSDSSFFAWGHLAETFQSMQSIGRLIRRILDRKSIHEVTWADIRAQLTVSDFPLQMCAITRGPLSRTDHDSHLVTIRHSRLNTLLNCLVIGCTVAFEIHCLVCVFFIDDEDVDLQHAFGDFGLPFATYRWFMNVTSAYSGFLLTSSMVCLNTFQTAAHHWPGRVSAWNLVLVKRGRSIGIPEGPNGDAERDRPEFIRLWIKMYILYVGAILSICLSSCLVAVYVYYDLFFLIPLFSWWSVLRSSLWALLAWVACSLVVGHIIFSTAEYLSEMLLHTYIVQRVRGKLLHAFNLTSNGSRDSSDSEAFIHALQFWQYRGMVSSLNLLDVSRRHLGRVRNMMSVTTFIFQVGPISAGLFWLFFVAYFSVTPAIIIICSLAFILCLIAVNGIAIPALRVRFLFSRLNPLLHGILVPRLSTRLSLVARLRIWATLDYVDRVTQEGVLWVGCCYPLVGSAYCYSLLEAGTYFLLLVSLIGTPSEQVLQQVKKS